MFSGAQNDTPKTADKIAKDTGVSSPTVKRYAKAAKHPELTRGDHRLLEKNGFSYYRYLNSNYPVISMVIRTAQDKKEADQLNNLMQKIDPVRMVTASDPKESRLIRINMATV